MMSDDCNWLKSTKTEFNRQHVVWPSNTKFNRNPYNGLRVGTCDQTWCHVTYSVIICILILTCNFVFQYFCLQDVSPLAVCIYFFQPSCVSRTLNFYTSTIWKKRTRVSMNENWSKCPRATPWMCINKIRRSLYACTSMKLMLYSCGKPIWTWYWMKRTSCSFAEQIVYHPVHSQSLHRPSCPSHGNPFLS